MQRPSSPPRVAITGATGFVGAALSQLGRERGWVVTRVTRTPRLPGDVSLEAALRSFPAVDAVVHLAGETVNGRWDAAKRALIRSSRVDLTTRLVESMGRSASPPTTLVSASAVGFYGDRGDEELTEDSAPGNDFLAEVCVQWEAAAVAARSFGTRVGIARLGVVLGLGGGALPPLIRAGRLGAGGPFGSGRQWWPWVHLADVAAAIVWMVEQPDFAGPANVVAPGIARQTDVARAVGAVLHRPAFLPAPAFGLRVLLGGFASELLASRKARPVALESSGFVFAHPTLPGAVGSLIPH